MDTDQQTPKNPTVADETPLSKKERRELRREEKRTAADSFRKARSLRRAVLWIIAIAALGGAAAGAAYLAINSEQNDSNGVATFVSDALSPSDWIRGNPTAKVALIEYGDFQCPACAQFHPLVKIMKEEFGNDVAFAFRHFPLSQAHPNAKAAARAAEAAGAQGKFWEMHDYLFEHQTEWAPKPSPKAAFVSYAQELGLNTDQFENDLDRDDLEDKINAQYQSGTASGVNSTPTFFLNGTKIENPRSYDEFRRLLTQAIGTKESNNTKPETTTTSTNETNP